MAQKATLLVVEDDVHLLQGIRDILELDGYSVITASSGVEGLDVLSRLPTAPDLIISDIMMPRMDGYQFFDAVRAKEEWTEVPFIFLTAKGEKADVRLGRKLGADDYIIKPMDPDDLLVIVEAKLRRRDQLRHRFDGRVSDVKRNILTILNHEFRTPLTYVVAYADMLNRDADELGAEEMRVFLHGLDAGAQRLRRLVENFIMLVELETGEAGQNFSWRKRSMTDIRPLYREVIGQLQAMAQEKGITLVSEAPEQVPTFQGDYEYLRTALLHLVENGIKFSDKPGATVELKAVHDDAELHLIVEDHGRGVPETELENIWQPFYQINRQQHEDQGAGAGLAIVKGVASLHGGRAEVQSTFGMGSRFSIVLPLVKPGG